MNQTQTAPALRNSAVELLRIVAMLMIVLSHICYHSGFDYTYSMLTVNRLFVQFGILGDLGVAVFILISGYFLSQKSFRVSSLSRLLSQVWFYSITLFLVCKFGFGYEYSVGSLLQVFLPTIFNEYWFFTAYIVLLLLTPFLNTLAEALSRSRFQTLLGCMLLIWVVIPTVSGQQMYASEIPQFLLYYLLGAYFRKFPDSRLRKKGIGLALAAGSFLLLYGLTVVLGYLERYTPAVFGASFRFYSRNSLLTAGCAVGLFLLAISCKPFTSRFLNTVSGCTFGVYLIHDNPAVREILWKELLYQGDYFTSGSFIPRLILSVLLVFVVCTLIEYLRQKTVAKPMSKTLDAILGKLLKNVTF